MLRLQNLDNIMEMSMMSWTFSSLSVVSGTGVDSDCYVAWEGGLGMYQLTLHMVLSSRIGLGSPSRQEHHCQLFRDSEPSPAPAGGALLLVGLVHQGVIRVF
ncbi:hypothetical protein TIFTF001_033606 [Ficus carica]|uniref:Uncharacterized protein n=1 Tax=Ficus carica TaxID=3494 RepID=A0AA88DZ32_FICCA|nr:hypothetical protein TIFTF001_033606 [Ficus carica]